MLTVAVEPDAGYMAWLAQREERRIRNGGTPVTELCGNMDGYRAHLAKGEGPCPECAHLAERVVESSAECGTVAGWRKHHKDGTPKCDECRDAYNKYHRELAWKHGRKPRTKPVCGTVSGATAHYKAKEPVCAPCREALNAYKRGKKI